MPHPRKHHATTTFNANTSIHSYELHSYVTSQYCTMGMMTACPTCWWNGCSNHSSCRRALQLFHFFLLSNSYRAVLVSQKKRLQLRHFILQEQHFLLHQSNDTTQVSIWIWEVCMCPLSVHLSVWLSTCNWVFVVATSSAFLSKPTIHCFLFSRQRVAAALHSKDTC